MVSARSDNRTILIVDDDPSIRLLLTRSLEDEGYQVRQAGDGLQAVQCLATNGLPDLLILDVGMPQMDGVGLLGELERWGWRRFPILVLTASLTAPSEMNGRVEDIVSKSIDVGDLLDRVARLLGSGSSRP